VGSAAGVTGDFQRLLRTEDGGRTWNDVTPPLAIPPEGLGDAELRVAFPSAASARVVYSFSDRTQVSHVWRTDDAGLTWAPSGLLPGDTVRYYLVPMEIAFVDQLHGFLVLGGGVALGSAPINILRTLDGGASWEVVSEAYDSDTGSIDSSGRSGMVFVDASTGWITIGHSAWDRPQLNWTRDGAQTWEYVELPPPPEDPELYDRASCGVYDPNLLSPTSGRLHVLCYPFNSDGELNFLYSTDDGGASWQIMPFPGGRMSFLNEDLGWSFGHDILKTRDGGQTWAKLSTVTWDGEFNFVDENHGWAVATSGEEIALVQTTDGGRTWTQIKPVVGP